MPKFIVSIKEVHSRDVIVEAGTPDEAIEQAHAGEYQELRDPHEPDATEFEHVLGSSTWTVKEDDASTTEPSGD